MWTAERGRRHSEDRLLRAARLSGPHTGAVLQIHVVGRDHEERSMPDEPQSGDNLDVRRHAPAEGGAIHRRQHQEHRHLIARRLVCWRKPSTNFETWHVPGMRNARHLCIPWFAGALAAFDYRVRTTRSEKPASSASLRNASVASDFEQGLPSQTMMAIRCPAPGMRSASLMIVSLAAQ